MIKAIFFDIDGTLLSYGTHQMLPTTVKAVGMLKQEGVKVFISSGRPMVLIPELPVHFDGYITVNGGYCTVGDNVLLRNPFDRDLCSRWVSYVEHNNLTTMCFTADKMYINRIDEASMALQRQLGFKMPPMAPLSMMEGDDVYRFIAMQDASKDKEAQEAIGSCRMPRWHPAFTDIIPEGSSKAVGMECIVRHLGIGRDEIMAFGDGGNDIEMLDYAGIGVAMGNADESVKSHAQYVTDDSESDGIWKALKALKVICG